MNVIFTQRVKGYWYGVAGLAPFVNHIQRLRQSIRQWLTHLDLVLIVDRSSDVCYVGDTR